MVPLGLLIPEQGSPSGITIIPPPVGDADVPAEKHFEIIIKKACKISRELIYGFSMDRTYNGCQFPGTN